MAWYDDPNFVNSSPLAPLPTVGIAPALPAAPRALNPEPTNSGSDPFADLDAAITRLAYPEETDTTPSGLAGIPENTAPVVTLEGLNQRIANKPEAPWVFGWDTLSAAKDYISNIPTFAKGAFYRLSEDNTRPDQYSPGAKAAFEEEARAQQQIEEERLRRERAGESTQLGSAIREAIPSSGFSLGSMGAAAAAGIPAAGLGTLAAGPVGGIVGGISGSMAGSGAAAYRMQRSAFLEDSFKAAEDKSLKENGRSLNESEKQQLYNELLPLANDSALWEAGPEAIGNAATLVGGGIALKLLGKGALSQIAGGAMKKAAIRAGAATAGVATELGTETATQKGQALADARRDAVLEGKPIDEAVSQYDMPGGGGTLQAFKDIAAPTLGTLVMFGLAGGAVKGGTKAYERIVTNPREAEEIVKLSNDPNIVAALPDSSLKNLSRMSEWLGNQWFQGPERKQLLDNALIKLNAEIANRESESGEIKAERKKTLQSLWDTMGPQEQLGVLGFLQNESAPMTGWVDKEGEALTDKQGRALGEIDVRGLAKLAPVLGLSGDVLQKNFEKVRGDWYARQEANQQQPSLLVDDYGREIDPKLVGATVPITSTSPSKQQQKQQTPLANLADAVPPTSLVPLPIETLTEKQKKDHVKNIAKISSTKATPEERASAESFLNQFSVVGSRPMDIAFGAKQKSTGVDSTAAPPIAPIEPNIADPNAVGKSMLDEALARQQSAQTPPVVEPTDTTATQAAKEEQQPVREVPKVVVGTTAVPTVTSGSQAIIQAISDEAANVSGIPSTSQVSSPSPLANLPSVSTPVAETTPVESQTGIQNTSVPIVQNSLASRGGESSILPEQGDSVQPSEPAQIPPVPVTPTQPVPVTPTPPKPVTPIPKQPKKESADVVRSQEGQAETPSLLDGKAPVTDPEKQWNDSTPEQRKERLLAVGSFQGGYLKQLTESEYAKLPEGLKPKLEKHLKSIVNQKSTIAVKEEGNAAIQGPQQDDNQPKHQGTGGRLGTGQENREQPTEEQGSSSQTGRSNQSEQGGEKQAVTPGKKKQTVVTPNGNKIDTEFEVVELDDLITSDRPEFPSELQPRNRSRVASETQVDKIANKLDPEQLAESRLASDGAPIIGPDQVVESGNGRVMAVRRVYSQSRLADKAAKYRKMIESRGFDTTGMKQPVLVRRRTTNLSTDERKSFTVDANTQNIAGLSPSERAIIHAGRLTKAILDLYQGGDLFSVKNSDFVRAFLDRVALNESSEMTTKDGLLNKEGVNRITNAIIAKAYNNIDFVDSLLESQDDNIKSLGGALLDVAPGMVKLKSKIESNLAPKDLDITSALVEAAQLVSRVRREGKFLKDLLNNESMFGDGPSPLAERIVKLFFSDESLRRQISREKIVYLLNSYLGYANEVKMSDPLFADVPSVTVNDIVKSLEDKKREGNKPVSTGSLFSGNAPSASGTANREEVQRPGDVAQGKESGTTELGESKGNGKQQPSEGQKQEVAPVESKKQEESAAQPKSITEVRDELVAYFKDGNGFKTIIQARNFIGDKLGTKIQPGTVRAKWADELVEQAIVKTAESIAKTVKDPVQAYNKLVALYEQQPNLRVRTSTSVENQAYSTPVPLAYLASKLAGISLDDNATVVEPTAGNGALLIEANPSQVLANEINEDRASWLKENGYDVSKEDATEWKPSKKTDILIANPPFGSVYSNGKRKTWTVQSSVSPTGNYQTGEIDHAIVLQQLANMEDDGVAVLLVGGVDAKNNKAKSDKYGAGAKRDFYWTLFNDYNVVDMFTVSGNLYAKQGAGYPVDVIVIHGRGKSALSVPAANIPRVYDSWNSLEGVLTNETLSAEQYRKTVAKASLPGSTGQPSPVGNRPDTGQPGTGNAGDSTAATEPVGNRPDVSKQDIPGERDSRSDARPGVSPAAEQPQETPATNQTGTRPVAPDVAGGVAPGKYTVENTDLNALFDEILAEETGSVQKQRTTKEAAKSAASNVAMGLGDIMDGLNALFGTKGKLGSGLAFDEETYAKAKPFFQAAIAHFEGAANDVKETMRLLIRALLNQFKDPGMVKNMQPYVVRFIEDMQKPQTPETKTTAEPTEIASDGQVPYSPASKQKMIGSLVPVNMLESVKAALSALEDRVGPIDEYVASELGYPVSELGKYFAAEQIDALALAINNIDNGKGFVIGDQTGVGKGRVNAGIIRWAIKNGKTPIFVTEKPNLYRDMIRDLRDIGMATGATNEEQIQSIVNLIQMTNSGESIPMDDAAMEWYDKAEAAKENNEKPPKPYGEFLKTPSAAKQAAVLNEITQSGNLPDGKKIVFTTYSQMQPVAGEPTARTHALQSLIGNSVLLLDESHNAGGTPQITAKKSFNRAEFVRDLVEKASGVFYSSATFAKRPDVMDLYSRTDMSLAVSNIKELGATIASGGIPLQQVVSSMLVESGQYLRRERSFDGVEYNTVSTESDKQVAENIATSMRNILEFSKNVASDVIAISEQIKAQATSIGATTGADMGSAESTNFTSVMHNLISQFLLGLKAQATVDKALEAIKNGEKPVITVANTMESLINEYADNNNIGIGEPIDLTFGDLLERYLEKSRMVREKKPFSKTKEPARRLEDSELSPITLKLYNSALAEIRRQDWSKIPASPLDYIKGELQKAGYKVGEITGRQGVIDYTGAAPIYRMRGENERGIPGRIKAIQQFNNGEIDVLLLNRAGSTGLSLHASPSVGKDLRRRHMIIAQAEGNIDTHMQMLGRVHRTGQVIAPKYSQLVGNIPAEIRPAAVLAKKMASLSANTTSARSSSVSAKDTFDFMNVYGDEAVANVMFSNQDVHARLGDPLSLSKSGDGFSSEDAARKVTGRLPILPIEQQEQLYRDIEAEYRSILETAIALGENKLEAMTLETDAKEVSSTPVFAGITGESSPFASSASAVVYDIKRQGRSMTQDEIRQELADFAGVPELKTGGPLKKKIDELSDTVWNEVRDFINREAANLSENELNSLETRTAAMRDKINQVLQSIPPGTSVSAVTPTGAVFYGIVVGIERKGKPKNPAANSAWQVKIAVADATRVLTLPLTRFEVGQPEVAARTGRVAIEPADYVEVQEAFERQSGMSRENRVILEGNLLAAYSQFSSGQIVYFRLNSGELKQGILMPRSFDLATALAKQAKIIRSSQEAANFLADESSKKYLIAQGGDVKIQFYPRHKNFPNHFIMTVPASKAQGGRWFLNDRIRAITDDFVKTGNKYMTAIRPVDLPSVLNIIYTDIGEQMKGVDESLISASSNNQSGNQYSIGDNQEAKAPLTVEQARAEVATLIGENQLAAMERLGKITFHAVNPTNQPNAQAFVDEKGNIHFVVENIQGNFAGIALHEELHLLKDKGISESQRKIIRLSHAVLALSGLKNFVGNASYDELVKQAHRMAEEGNPHAVKALAKAKEVSPSSPDSEFVNYLVEYAPAHIPFVRRVMSKIRAVLYRMGIKVELRPEDLRELALSAFKQRANQAAKAQEEQAKRIKKIDKQAARFEGKYGPAALQDKRVEVLRSLEDDTTQEEYSKKVLDALKFSFSQEITDEFKRWSRGYPVIHDSSSYGQNKFETGKPFIAKVYHGSKSGDIEFFDNKLLGVNTGAPSAKRGFFFSGTPETASAPYYIGEPKEGLEKHLTDNDFGYSFIGTNIKYENKYSGLSFDNFAKLDSKGLIPIGSLFAIELSDYIREKIDPSTKNYDKLIHGITFKKTKNGWTPYYSDGHLSDYLEDLIEAKNYAVSKIEKSYNDLIKENIGLTKENNPTIYPVYIRLSNPLVYDQKGHEYREKSYDSIIIDAKKSGNDGVVILNTYDGGGLDNIFVVFDDKSIKGYYNTGTYDETNRLLYSIAPSELPIETAKILGEDSSWNLNPDLQGRVVAALRNPLQTIKVGVEKARPVWLGLLDRQMLVEMIENLPGVGPIAIQFQKTARKLDAMKQELKQKMYPVAEALAEQIARSRDKGYKFSRLLYGSTLHQVDPLGLPPDPAFVGASYDEKQRFAEKEKWYKIVKGWADELERENPALFKLYKEMRANYDYMLNERFNALMARLGRSSEDVVTSLLDHAKSKAEKNIDPMVQQLSQLQRDNDKTYRRLKASLMAVMPQLYPPKKVTIHNYLNPPKAPAPQPVSVIRSKLDASARPLFDAMMERLENATTDGDLQRKIFFGLMAKAEYLTREQGKPGSLSLSGKLASLYKANPKEFDALQTALSAYLSKPNSVIKYEMVPSKRNPNVTIRTISVVDLQNDPLSVEARANLSEEAQKLFVEAARNSQDRIKESAGAIKYFYETAMAQGPYANLMRYGKYEIYAEKEGEKLPIFAKFEDPRDQKRAALALQAEGWTVNSGYQIENRVFEQAPTGSFVGNLIGLVDDVVKNEQEKATLKDDINQLYLASLPDMSASKHFMHRKGIPGFSQDVLRGYAQFMNQSANAIARLNFSDIMIRNLRDLKKANDALGVPYDEESSKMQAMAGSVINELNDSYEWQMNPTNSTLANRITGLGFFWYLTNFSTALINMSQVPLMTFPDLAARYGAKNATSEIMKAVKEYGKWKFNWGEGKKKAEEAIDARFDGDMGRMLQFLEKTGAKSRTETVSLAGMGEEDAYFSSNPVVMWANKFAKALSFPFQQSEIANREISAIAAYTLARQAAKDKTPEDAHQYAQEIAYNTVFRTQNDFSNANRARYWRSDLARILLLFKSYAKLMTWRQLRDAHQAFKEIPSNLTGEDKARFEEEKQIAKHRLAYMGAASLVFGGAMGFPLYTIFITIANAFFGNDPDDPYDVETEVNQALQSMAMSLTNNEQSADLIRQTIMKGPVGALMGSDLSPRLSLDLARLWFRKIPEQKTGDQWGLAALQQAAGPVFGGMFIGAAKGTHDIIQGINQGNTSDVSRGVEGILPAPARNAIKTWRYITQGVETRRGDKIVDDLSAYEAAMQAIGFAPARVADQYDRNAAMMEVKGWLDTRRKNLINGYVYAVENQDYKKANEFMKDITEFNVKNPSLWIKQDSLIKAMKNRERVRANSNGGLYIPSKGMRARLEDERY